MPQADGFEETIRQAQMVLRTEAEGILRLADRVDGSFAEMVRMIYASPGRVIVAGIGKSGIVGRKISATLNSTGTPALFLHPVEAMHGDLGMVGKDDVFLALSNSGETDELNALVPSIRSLGCPVIALTGKCDSTLAKASDLVVYTGVEKEACPLGLAPTASTTALLAMGDALAVALITKNDFKTSDFKRFHPGGKLGQRLCARVSDIMITGAGVPCVPGDMPMEEAIREMDRLDLGTVLVRAGAGLLAGIVTDGDLRRFLLKGGRIETARAKDVMTRGPKTVSPEGQVSDALELMEKHLITLLPVTDGSGKILGVLHLHDILGKGTVRFNGV